MGYYCLLSVVLFFLSHLAFSSFIPHLCPKDQSLALQTFNETFTIDLSRVYSPYPVTSTWNMGRDCCLWDGVICDASTGHVVELHLDNSGLVGKIDSNSSLFQLSHLQWLDLSGNNFSYSHISPEFGKFPNMTHLDLANSNFSGQIPSEISHLSKLQSLRLSPESNKLRLTTHDFKMLLQNLTLLRELDLNFVNISSTLPPNISSYITILDLESTRLYGTVPHHIFHLPNLETLDLSYNDQLTGCFPKTKWNSSASLMHLILDEVKLSCNLPESLGYLTSLQILSLPHSNLAGSIPQSLSNLTRIEYLILNDNQLQGHLPSSIQTLVSLTLLRLSSNNFSGNVDVTFFSNLTHLFSLGLSHNRISLISENTMNATLPESLVELYLADCDVKELEFLRSAKHLLDLDLSNNKIQGRIPDWAWSNWMLSLGYLNLSHNMLTNVDSIPLPSLGTIDLRSNFLQGPLPIPPNSTRLFFISNNNLSGEIPLSICNSTSLEVLDLAKNNFRGEIPQCLGDIISLGVLMMSHNNLSEEIPWSICNLTSLKILDLGGNYLKGAIPQCFGNMSDQLEVLDMHNNNLSGTLPTTFSNKSVLRSFNVRDNKLEGKIPRSLGNCKELQVLDFGDNYLNSTFPMWLGTLPKLQVLSLRSNKLYGSIRTSRIEIMFPALQIIDLSYNLFTGNLPMSLFQKLKAMRTVDESMKEPRYLGDEYYQDSITVATKGLELELVRILTVYTAIDLSSNRFEGRIPSILGNLTAVRVLNLSHNGLQGHIPPSFGNLSFVESLDLSSNQLSGEIPGKLASLTYLAFLNLSQNQLEGCIPGGSQFATFQNSSFEGNHGLRGFPLSKGCGEDRSSETNSTTSVLEDEHCDSEFFIEFLKAALVGYGSGLCIGLSIIYVMISTGYPMWLARLIVRLEHKIIMRGARSSKIRGTQADQREEDFD